VETLFMSLFTPNYPTCFDADASSSGVHLSLVSQDYTS
jgi:hypothetical protein